MGESLVVDGLSASALRTLVITAATLHGGDVSPLAAASCIQPVGDGTTGTHILGVHIGVSFKMVQIQLSVTQSTKVSVKVLEAKFTAGALACNAASINAGWDGGTASTVATSSSSDGYGIKDMTIQPTTKNSQWVSSFTVKVSSDGSFWSTVDNGVIFRGNAESNVKAP